jgi:hypothetical protein
MNQNTGTLLVNPGAVPKQMKARQHCSDKGRAQQAQAQAFSADCGLFL